MDYFDELLLHQIKSIFYSNYEADLVVADIEELINEIEEELQSIKSIHSVKEANEYLYRFEDLITGYINNYENHMKSVATSISEKESNWYASLILNTYALNVIIPEKLNKNISLIPYTTTNTIKSFSASVKQKLNNTVKNNLNTGVFWGYGGDQLVENIEKPLDAIKRSISTETQEMVQSFVKNVQGQIQKENKEIFTGYKWCSILDSRVCDLCAELNGTVYKDMSTVPFLPVHYRCRCSVISFVQEVVEPDWDSFSDWVEDLGEEDQLTVLGKKRFELWKDGSLELSDFVNDGHKIRLEDLYGDE